MPLIQSGNEWHEEILLLKVNSDDTDPLRVKLCIVSRPMQ
jgi:hypothetical protein